MVMRSFGPPHTPDRIDGMQEEITRIVRDLLAGLADKDAKAFVKVPCPSCHQNNQIVFTPEDGTMDEVFADEGPIRYKIPVPSYN